MKRMRLLLIFALSTLLSGCDRTPTQDLLLGQWKIKSWFDSERNGDLMKMDGAPECFVDFAKDSVFILEKESNKSHDYKFKWTLNSDSLKIKNLGDFRVVNVSGDELFLSATGKNIFSKKKKLYKHEIKLIRLRK